MILRRCSTTTSSIPRSAGGGGAQSRLAERVTDYIAGMTDRYCLRAYEALTVPRGVRL